MVNLGNGQSALLWSDLLLREISELWPGQVESLTSLYGDTDQNIRLNYSDNDSRVLKITASGSEQAAVIIELQVAALLHIQGKTAELNCPVPVAARDGGYVTAVCDREGGAHHAWMLSWLPGRVLDEVSTYEDSLLHSIGRSMALIDNALLDFDHPVAHRRITWDLANVLERRSWLKHIHDSEDRRLATAVFDLLERQLLQPLSKLPSGIIHNDGGNQHNMLLSADPGDNSRISGVIDFGDIVYTHRLCELGVAAAYSSFGSADRVHAISTAARGYHEVMPLAETEQRLLPLLVLCRYLLSVCHAAERSSREPDNAYAQVSAASAWAGLRYLMSRDMEQVADSVCERLNDA